MPPKTKKDKHERFIELAEKRVNRALKDLRLIGKLSNTNNYSYTDEEVRKIFAALEDELKAAREQFEKTPKKDVPSFSLRG